MKKFFLIVSFSWIIYFGLWFVVYKLNINTLPIQSEDTIPAIFIPVAIVQDSTIYLDKFYNMMLSSYPNPDDKEYTKGLLPFYLRKVGDHYVSAFTIITPLLVTPLYFVANLFNVSFDWDNLIILSHLGSSFV